MQVRGATAALAALGSVLGAVLGSCGDGAGVRAGVDLGGSWRLVAGSDAQGPFDLTVADVTLVVDGDSASGTSACNQYFADVEVEGDRVAFTGVGGTEMGCDPAVMELEQRYTAALMTVAEADRDEATLRLTGPGVALDLEPEPPVAEADLVGTVWVLDSLVEGETVSSTMPGGELVLAGDRTLRGSSGCRPLSGRYVLEGARLTVTGLEAGPPSGTCESLAEDQHAHVVGVLGAGVEVTVAGRSLTLTAADGRGLHFLVSP